LYSRASNISPRRELVCAASSGASKRGLNPALASVASRFASRWHVATAGKAPIELTNRLGIAVA
jgi:transaldolase